MPGGSKGVRGEERARLSTRVESDEPLFLGRPEHSEHITADSGHVGFHDVEDRGGGHRGIDRVTAPEEDLQSGFARERLAGGDRISGSVHRRPPRSCHSLGQPGRPCSRMATSPLNSSLTSSAFLRVSVPPPQCTGTTMRARHAVAARTASSGPIV
jgi:hypothetical protein